jgi:outer membrane protein TolC
VMGIQSDSAELFPTDSLTPPADVDGDGAPPTSTTLEVAAAEQSLAAATLAARLQRRSVWGAPSVTLGFDTHDPGGNENALLPVFGLSLPLPLFGRKRGAIALANGQLQRARAAKVRRDRALVVSADRVAAMSLTAYREGESSLPNVLEAQRNAREILGQYIDDTAQAWIAAAALRVFTVSVQPSQAR